MNRFLKKQRTNMGIILLLFAIPLTNIISFVTRLNMSSYSNLLLIIALFLLVDIKKIKKFKLHMSIMQIALFLLNIIFLLMACINKYSFFQGSGAIIYTLFTIFLMIALFSREEWNRCEDFPKLLFYISGVFTIFSLFTISDGFKNLYSTINGIYNENGELIADRLSISTFSIICIYACLSYNTKDIKEKCFKLVFSVCSLLMTLIVFKRGLVIEVTIEMIILIFYKLEFKKIKTNSIITGILTFIFIIILMILLLQNNKIKENIERLWNSANNAIITLIGNEKNTKKRDESALVRYSLRKETLENYKSISLTEFLFGKGYMYRYLDFPLLQILVDGGIFIGVLYFIIMIIYPLKHIIKKPRSEMEKIIFLFAFNTFISSFYSGIPYGYNRYLYIIIILFFEFDKTKNIRKVQINEKIYKGL